MKSLHLLVPFPMTPIGGGETHEVVTHCDRQVRPRYVVVSRTIAPDFVITDVKVGRNSQLPSAGVIPADAIAGDLEAIGADDSEPDFLTKTKIIAPPLDLERGSTITLVVRNLNPCGRYFSAVAFCLDEDSPQGDEPAGPVLPTLDSIVGPCPPDKVDVRFTRDPVWRPRDVEASNISLFSVKGISGWFRKSDENISWRWPRA